MRIEDRLGDVMDTHHHFAELQRYVGLTAEDEARIAALVGPLQRVVGTVLDEFYTTILAHPGASAAFRDPEAQIPRQRGQLERWLRELLQGNWDRAHFESTVRVGKAHVVHKLPARYMHGGMNILRRGLAKLAFEVHAGNPDEILATIHAVDRVLDIELWVMLRTYHDDLLLQMQRRERLATVGELSAGIHHELKNPLASIHASTQALAERRAVRADSRSSDLVRSIGQDAERASEIVTDLLSFARLREPRREPVSVDDLVGRAVGRVSIPPRCRIESDLDPALPHVHVDAAQVLQILINVLENAVEACPGEGTIQVVARLKDGAVILRVADDGVGMGPGELNKLFEPLYTTKPDGVGLGMSVSLQLAQANDVSLDVSSESGEGTTVALTLPTAAR